MGKNYTETFHVCIFSPVIEELIFRFLLQEVILKRGANFGIKKLGIPVNPNNIFVRITIVALSSLVFASMHDWAFSASKAINPFGAASLVYLFANGLIFGLSQERTGNIFHPIAIHMINNSLSILISGNELSGASG